MKLKPHFLTNLLFAFLISFFVFGCSARKTQTSIHKSEKERTEVIKSDIKTDEKTEVKTSTTEDVKDTETVEGTKQNVIKDQNVTVTIEPAEGEEWSVYDFVVGNTVFKGTSKGKVTFTNQLKIDSINESIKVVKEATKNVKKDSSGVTNKHTDAKVDSKTTEKEKTKDKEKTTDKKEPIWFNIGITVVILVSVILISIFVYSLLKRYRILK